jgi:hypothetical protein
MLILCPERIWTLCLITEISMKQILVTTLLVVLYHFSSWSQVRYTTRETKFRQKPTPIAQYEHKVIEKFAKIDIRSIADVKDPGKELDDFFYIKWGSNKKLNFDDFRAAQAVYKQIIPEKDTDLLRAVYPSYTAFYKVLDKRREADASIAIDSVYNGTATPFSRPDSMIAGYIYSASFDAGLLFEKDVDSPAASVLAISPALYAINDSTYYYNIVALFSKYESWMIIRSADILQHEQIHFDIFELHARKLRKSWLELVKSCHERGAIYEVGNELAPIYDQLYLQLYSMQLELDRETAELTGQNAPLIQLNAKWEKAIKAELDELKEYENAEGIIVIK